MAETSTAALPSWRPGQPLWPDGRNKLVVLGGLSSRTGDSEKSFSGLARYLGRRGGYRPQRDVLEATYAGRQDQSADIWLPRPYTLKDTRQPLAQSIEAVAGVLDWYRDVLPPDARLFLLGHSLGGVALLDGAALAVARDRAGWKGRILGLVTLAAPLLGCSAGPLMSWAWLFTQDTQDPLGAVGEDLDRRWRDADERARIRRRAEFLRAAGARVLTLADPDDAVVRPDEALLPSANETPADLLVYTPGSRRRSYGHGALVDDPSVWSRIESMLGPQQGATAVEPESPSDTPRDPDLESELEAIKARLRAEGRLPKS